MFEYPNVREESGCLTFGGCFQHGYGIACIGGARFRAHRRAWEEVNGPIPDGLTVDHVCRNTRCIEVSHLRLLTLSENTKCSARAEKARAKTHCPAGHEYRGENVYVDKRGARHCYACTKDRTRVWQEREKARKAETRAQSNTCRSGKHEMTAANTALDSLGVRRCVACSRATKLRWYNKTHRPGV